MYDQAGAQRIIPYTTVQSFLNYRSVPIKHQQHAALEISQTGSYISSWSQTLMTSLQSSNSRKMNFALKLWGYTPWKCFYYVSIITSQRLSKEIRKSVVIWPIYHQIKKVLLWFKSQNLVVLKSLKVTFPTNFHNFLFLKMKVCLVYFSEKQTPTGAFRGKVGWQSIIQKHSQAPFIRFLLMVAVCRSVLQCWWGGFLHLTTRDRHGTTQSMYRVLLRKMYRIEKKNKKRLRTYENIVFVINVFIT